ncbi:hypothetical protein A3E39_00485 [Candidatus Uhrbacteria bacterium RIFCSPHIGHO2_12_FULL_60_25]|uniref:Uncharacterized protein n=1 Tax=Candidatus Uhrbacteria bacterium RIFCSPHIGHO2_12_FULL_60_25 TaxID=1802399 RepID=A0A1F7ULT1_9BACT|nr:MAG: hypothetical protein A3E39_00485 [Candidatus Uhrbacteria bacterium RIFCSPHIGHO2_12_FULL_60_25]
MSTKPEFPRFLYILIVLGIISPIILGFLAAFFLTVYLPRPYVPPAPASLGERGTSCGGPGRWPCKPGLVCTVAPDEWTTKTGECVTDTRPVYPPGSAGNACDNERGCAPGLVCDRTGVAAGTCVSPTSTTPSKP